MKKNILFFSRCELAYLYGSLDKYLTDKYNFIHIAYSDDEYKVLCEKFQIKNVIHFKNELRKITEGELSKITLEEIDTFLLKNTFGNFNVNGALSANRTSQYLTYEENIKLIKIYYLLWKNIFLSYKIDYFIHEPVSLLMNQIAACFCNEYKVIYSTHILLTGEVDDSFFFTMVDSYNGEPTSLYKHYNTISLKELNDNKERIEIFLKKTRERLNVFFAQLSSGKISLKEYCLLKLKSYYSTIKRTLSPLSFDPIIDNIDLFIYKNNFLNKRVRNLKAYREIIFEDLDTTKEYYYYPMHLEPEAVVLYWANNKYTNQIKLIENIASQLPPDTFLYVKDHPHSPGYRSVEDYKRLKAIPNVKLLKTSIPGKQVIHHCKGVITINGTGGFEALMLNKQVITFGNSFYKVCKRVHYLDNVFHLRKLLYSLREVQYEDDEELYRFTLAYLKNLLPGFTDFYSNMHKKLHINLDENAKTVANSLDKWITFISSDE